MKIIILLVLSLICAPSFSSENLSSKIDLKRNLNSFLSKLDTEIALSSELLRDDKNRAEGLYNKFDLSFLYKLTENDELRLFGSTIYKTYSAKESESYLDLTEIMYRRKNILTKKDHGIDLMAELKNYYLLDNEKRRLYSFDGAFVGLVEAEKSFTRSFSLTMRAKHYTYFRKNSKDSTKRNETRLSLIPSYYLGSGFVVMIEARYRNKRFKDSYFSFRSNSRVAQENDTLYMIPSLMYVFNKSAVIEGYFETKLTKSHDNKLINEDYLKSGVFGASLYMTLF